MVGIAGLIVLVAIPLALTQDTTLQLTPSEAEPNQVVTVKGSGFGACLPDVVESQGQGLVIDPGPLQPPPPPPPPPPPVVTLTWDDGRVLGEPLLDATGSFRTTITVPTDAAPGGYLVTATCRSKPDVSEPEVLTVLAPPTTPPTTSPTTTTRPRPTTANPPATTADVSTTEPTTASPPSESDEATSADVEPAAFQVPLGLVVLLVLAVLLGLVIARALRSRRGRERGPRNPVVTAAVVPSAPPSLDVRPLGRERTVALSVVVRSDPGELTVSGRGER